jgi:16S rRNA (cytosine967-C5)-methyltransferase
MQNLEERSLEGLPAREAALKMLDAVLRRGLTMDDAAHHARSLPPADAALAAAIVGEALRRLPDLDALIDSATRLNLADDAKARMVLRLALAQKIGLGTPDHALVATALPLVDGGPRRLVHGVLGTLLRRGFTANPAPRLPDAVEHRWADAWGEEQVLAARRAIAKRPPLDLSFASDVACSAFEGGISLAPRHRRIDHAGSVTSLPGFGEGGWWVQDLASSLPARLVPGSAKRVLDACAAPGGKTMQLAAAGHRVVALDRSESRLARLSENLARTGLAAETVTAVLYRAHLAIIEQRAEFQARLLAQAATWVRPGGSLVYAVCSLEPQEGEQQIDAFLADRPDYRIEPAPALVEGVAPDARGRMRVLPAMVEDRGGLDGFFAAHLVRDQ